MCRLTTCHNSLVLGSEVRRPAAEGITHKCAGLPNATILWCLEAKSGDQQRKAEQTYVQAYHMSQLICAWKQSPETSRPSECTTRANHGATQHAFFLHTFRAHGSPPSAGESCTLMDRCSCAHARTRPCEASTGLATISAAKGSALTVGHLTARSQAPQSPRQLGCRRAAGSLYPRGACGTAASGPAASGSGGNPTTSGSCNGPAELLALAAGGKASRRAVAQ